MKVALYVHCFFPGHYHGTETYTLALAENLKKLGHEPVVVSAIFEGEKKAKSLITRYDYNGIPVYCIDKNHIPQMSLRDTYYQPELRHIHANLLHELQPDIVHVTHLLNHTAILLDVIKDLEIPAVATFTDFFGFCMNVKLEGANGDLCKGPNSERTNCFTCCAKAGIKRAYPAMSEQRFNKLASLLRLGCISFNAVHRLPVLRRSQLSSQLEVIKVRPELLSERYSLYRAVIAPTRFLQSAYEANGFTSVPIHKIHFGVDLDRKPKPGRSGSAPTRFGFIGQIAPHKGTALLVEAFCRLPAGQGELHIYGSESQHPAYFQALKQHCAGFAVYFHGTFPTGQIRPVLDEMDFLVIPSTWYENSPLVLLNALASHTPVIVSDVEGLTEFLQPDVNGYKFARGDVDDLERVMLQVITSKENMHRLIHSTNYPKTSMSMTEEVLEVYSSILKEKIA
ncbi:Glycosyltransferase Family 4 [Nitrosospira multiformis ATCC 25196]|uniref:Glycosyl transferase, group 1 n=1 Tax=Nitrosospira multiformis (strain ATCC 25196 / NCIMB 11849 / C 71) TaxID=323848 RepID=Q2Y6D2_NITMU|nr:glycosyltransferase family 4 protein [Nitrosospira multiformis]ABB75689.1 Glycosyl transferase, group 1 [Nitrosospira multiformis ATCC 25196]SEG17759.1 Glycosyltransferase Family 4 [Nitrosospira multiformis ATCC 25196]